MWTKGRAFEICEALLLLSLPVVAGRSATSFAQADGDTWSTTDLLISC